MFSVKSGNYDGALKTTPYISRIWTVDLPRAGPAAAAPHASLKRHRTVYGVWWDAPRATAGAARPRGQTPRSVPSMIRREVHRTALLVPQIHNTIPTRPGHFKSFAMAIFRANCEDVHVRTVRMLGARVSYREELSCMQ